MRLGRIVGTTVSTIKVGALTGHKLLLVVDIHPGAPQYGASARAERPVAEPVYVAIDQAGAGEGDVVLVTFGSAARIGHAVSGVPTDASVVGIVDSIQYENATTFAKR